MSAQVCPHCRSDLDEYYAEHGADTSALSPLIYFLVRWAAHILMLYIPFVFLLVIVLPREYEDVAEFLLKWGFIAIVIATFIYREKLPIF